MGRLYMLHKSADSRGFPFPGQTYPTASVRGTLVHEALTSHAANDWAAMLRYVGVAKQADKMEAALGRLQSSWYSPANASRATDSRVDVRAPLIPTEPPAG